MAIGDGAVETKKRTVRAGNVARFVESVGAWVHAEGDFYKMAWALSVSREWLAEILINTGLAGVDCRPAPHTTAQDVINVVCLYYMAMVTERLQGAKHV